jgi:hypothetical protein
MDKSRAKVENTGFESDRAENRADRSRRSCGKAVEGISESPLSRATNPTKINHPRKVRPMVKSAKISPDERGRSLASR